MTFSTMCRWCFLTVLLLSLAFDAARSKPLRPSCTPLEVGHPLRAPKPLKFTPPYFLLVNGTRTDSLLHGLGGFAAPEVCTAARWGGGVTKEALLNKQGPNGTGGGAGSVVCIMDKYRAVSSA